MPGRFWLWSRLYFVTESSPYLPMAVCHLHTCLLPTTSFSLLFLPPDPCSCWFHSDPGMPFLTSLPAATSSCPAGTSIPATHGYPSAELLGVSETACWPFFQSASDAVALTLTRGCLEYYTSFCIPVPLYHTQQFHVHDYC